MKRLVYFDKCRGNSQHKLTALSDSMKCHQQKRKEKPVNENLIEIKVKQWF